MEEISTLGEAIQPVTSGVESIDGQTGALTTKTINGEVILGEGNIATATTADITSAVNAEAEARAQADGELQTAINGKQSALSTDQLSAVNSGIDSTKVAQIATNTGNISTINGKIPTEASTTNQLADKNFVNSSVATNTANYISDNGQPFTSLADLEAYSGTLTNNDYAFVVGTDSAGNTTYTRYKYNATTQEWAEEYVLNNSSFTSTQWSAINSGITSGDVTKLSGIESGAEVNDIDSISVNGTAVTPDEHKNVDITVPTYTDFTGTDGVDPGTAGLVPAPATTDAGKFLKADGTWDTAGGGVTPVQTTGTSTTDVMSQDATTKMVFPQFTDYPKGIGIGNEVTTHNGGISIGEDITGANNATLIGRDLQGYASGIAIASRSDGAHTKLRIRQNSIVIGKTTTDPQQECLQIGHNAGATGTYGIALGSNAQTISSGIALGAYSSNSTAGTVEVGSTNANYGYLSTNYRKITGVFPGENEHDVATVAQGNTLATTAPTTATAGVLGQLYTDTTNMHTYQCTAIDTTDPNNPSYTWTQRW